MFSDDIYHQRFIQQASWTYSIRNYLLGQANLSNARFLLEVGCGTGVLLKGFKTYAAVHGLDIDHNCLLYAKKTDPIPIFSCGDAHDLPYFDAVFDIVFCHFLILWLSDPSRAIAEMVRVVRHGGSIIAFAEPDYGGRIDHPDCFSKIGIAQLDSLRHQGADPLTGRKLSSLFHQAGLTEIETGVIQGQWSKYTDKSDFELEWQILELDLAGIYNHDEIKQLKDQDWISWQNGERVLYIPTFYAIGKKAYN